MSGTEEFSLIGEHDVREFWPDLFYDLARKVAYNTDRRGRVKFVEVIKQMEHCRLSRNGKAHLGSAPSLHAPALTGAKYDGSKFGHIPEKVFLPCGTP